MLFVLEGGRVFEVLEEGEGRFVIVVVSSILRNGQSALQLEKAGNDAGGDKE